MLIESNPNKKYIVKYRMNGEEVTSTYMSEESKNEGLKYITDTYGVGSIIEVSEVTKNVTMGERSLLTEMPLF